MNQHAKVFEDCVHIRDVTLHTSTKKHTKEFCILNKVMYNKITECQSLYLVPGDNKSYDLFNLLPKHLTIVNNYTYIKNVTV